ncbi:hypothetical protein [Bradyrhizobium sp. 187]|uniref:hypothetical protein n=1 Tax=Bradyrhizobium sp. 187 TaxID=2782655 RepID=UPI001FFF1A33|nr:hypothetical protein [Bradyrhizobium sp. 187]UPJ69877.1 hypothetical protein IVB19_19255 [Bradyrhizobium sp. 187]
MSSTDAPNKFLSVSYLTDAKEYLQAAIILHDSQYDHITSPQYFLISQGIELFLKAFIIASGGAQADLKKSKIRHSLVDLTEMASKLGHFAGDERTIAVIELLHPHHLDHSFRYRKTGFKKYSAVSDGLATLRRMDREISPIVRQSIARL